MLKVNRIFVIGCWLAGAGLVFLNFRLVDHNRELSTQVEAFYRSIEVPVGARVPPVHGFDRDGGEVFVDPITEELPVLLLVFSPFCPACDENWPMWQPLLAAQRASGGKVIPVDISGVVQDDYLIAHGIDSEQVMIECGTGNEHGLPLSVHTPNINRARGASGGRLDRCIDGGGCHARRELSWRTACRVSVTNPSAVECSPSLRWVDLPSRYGLRFPMHV